MPLELKATAVLDHKLTDDKGKALPHPIISLVVSGELLPMVPIQHHILAALLDKDNPPEVDVKYGSDNNVLSFVLTFEHEDDVVAAGKTSHDLELLANNCIPVVTVAQFLEAAGSLEPPITVEELLADKKAAARVKAQAEFRAKEAAKG